MSPPESPGYPIPLSVHTAVQWLRVVIRPPCVGLCRDRIRHKNISIDRHNRKKYIIAVLRMSQYGVCARRVLAGDILRTRACRTSDHSRALSRVSRPWGDVRPSGESRRGDGRHLLARPVRVYERHRRRRNRRARRPVAGTDTARPRPRFGGLHGSDGRLHGRVLFSRRRPSYRPGHHRNGRREVPRLRTVTVAHANPEAPTRGYVVRGKIDSVLLRRPSHRRDSDETYRDTPPLQLQPRSRRVLRDAHHSSIRTCKRNRRPAGNSPALRWHLCELFRRLCR